MRKVIFRQWGPRIMLLTAFTTTMTIANSHSQTLRPVEDGIAERGQDFAVYRSGRYVTNLQGQVDYQVTNRFTLLENGLHYQDAAGQWKESKDVIESFANGAIAQYGPNRVIFSPDLNSSVVFDIETSQGQRIRGGVRQIQLTDTANGRSIPLATVKQSVKAELFAPNKIVWADGFDGLKADVVCVWKHNSFSHNVLIREQPVLPVELKPETTRLEIVTEFVDTVDPKVDAQTVKNDAQPDFEDHTVIRFSGASLIMGKALPISGGLSLGDLAPSESGHPVLKQWHALPDGRRFLIESIGWNDFKMASTNLPAPQANNARSMPSVSLARVWPSKTNTTRDRSPVQLAANSSYQPKGYLLDFVTIPTNAPTTFLTGETYYITNTYYTGNSISFQPGCILKYMTNAYMLLYGPISFPDTQQTPVFTSRNDDGFGAKIMGIGGQSDSDGVATNHPAAQAIWIYYVTSNTTIKNARFRYATRGIQYDQNSGVTAAHTVSNVVFENMDSSGSCGIYANTVSGSVTLSNVRKGNVTTGVQWVTGGLSGSISDLHFYSDKQFMGFQEAEDLDNLVGQPDPMGAVGPTNFVQLLNYKMRVFDKSGKALEDSLAADIFGARCFDPHILYDPLVGHWFATALNPSSRLVHVAQTVGTSPLKANWSVITVPIGGNLDSSLSLDWDTLGFDRNGLYIGVDFFATSYSSAV